MSRQSLRGFTLIELLVVIAIIGILSAIVIASLGLARNRGGDAGIKSALVGARTQAELFYTSNGNRYAASLVDTTTNVCNPSGLVGGTKGIYDQVLDAAETAGLSSSDIQTSVTTAGAPQKATCHACPPGITSGNCGGLNGNAWAAEVPLKTGGFWCVDSSGFSAYNAASGLAAGDTRCL